MKKPILFLFFLIGSLGLFSQGIFETPVLMKADGKIIDITSHTAPYLYDFNGDGIKDLIVGDFGDIHLEGMKEDPVYGRYVQGRCHIFINSGSNKNPVYGESKLLMSKGEPAFVPITCCVGFTPRFVDLDNDGIDDVISGSYPGELYLFRGLGNGEFDTSEIILDNDGDSLVVAHSTVAEPFDYDNDGDYDLIISTRMDGTFLSINQGTKSSPVFIKGQLIKLEKYDYVYKGLNEPRKSRVSHAYPADWDDDGLFDLVCGTEEGHLVWYKNTGTPHIPKFTTASTLFTSLSGFDNVEGGDIPPIGGRVKVFPTDYNMDGKLDLLVGDFYSTTKTIRELTPREEMEWDNSKNRDHELLMKLKDMYPDVKAFRNVAFFEKFEGLTKKELKAVQKINKERANLEQILAKYRKLQEYHSHGYVWLFTRK